MSDKVGCVTKEMWTVVLAENGAWLPTDIFADTESEAVATLELIRRNPILDIKPERWKGARVARCLVHTYPPNNQTGQSEAK